MSSIKELKNDINFLTYELINECFTFKIYHPEKGTAADKAVAALNGTELDGRTIRVDVAQAKQRSGGGGGGRGGYSGGW